jgi:hexosaminidase
VCDQYLDCGRGQWLDFPNGETIQAMYPFNDWCNPTKNWRLIYAYEPRDGVADDAKDNVLGGEVALWTETVDPVSLDTLLWPRAGAAAEVWWSGRVDADGVNRTETDARPRLSEQRERMLLRGVRGTPITQQWCDMSDVGDCTHTN